ncbi:intraflagellar transport protein 46 homolog [Bicyclus anynana]|uniref:Intraflagellar transport protein 46 homolog n=1 Tax=Bicyclus anynana TaxID=110368 RepID=A0A6J1NXJ5_BICAN|nr:intraflagellar transport protein 46 homolog [Bicyclus anynana]
MHFQVPSHLLAIHRVRRSRAVAMATGNKHDKHCQTLSYVKQDISGAQGTQGMYDETVEVNAREIESPPSSEDEAVKAAMAKFNPPVRHTARHDFDSESDSDTEVDKFGNISEEDQSPDRKSVPEEELKQKAKSTSDVSRQSSKNRDSSNSDTDSADGGTDIVERMEPLAGSGRRRGAVLLPDGAYDPKHYQHLKVPPDMENVFQYIMKYTPQKIDISLKLAPFVPEFVPAVGDTDAFLKVSTPPVALRGAPLAEHALEHIDNLGLTVLDEPSAEQSDSALLHLQLRALSKSTSAKSTVLTRKIDHAEKNPKAIERWVRDVSELHLAKPPPTFTYTCKMPDIDSLMEEWPETMEDTLNEVGFPPANIDCTLSQYVDLVCALFDIPVQGDTLNDRIQALHLLFNLYSAVKNSQLYAEREKEKAGG